MSRDQDQLAEEALRFEGSLQGVNFGELLELLRPEGRYVTARGKF